MQLRHFGTVASIKLYDVVFQSFWDFRRFIVAFSALSYLEIDNVQLRSSPSFQLPGVLPSLLPGACNLSTLCIYNIKSWNPLWLWVTTIRRKYSKDTSRRSSSALSPYDANSFWLLLKLGHQPRLNNFHEFTRQYDEENEECELLLRGEYE